MAPGLELAIVRCQGASHHSGIGWDWSLDRPSADFQRSTSVPGDPKPPAFQFIGETRVRLRKG